MNNDLISREALKIEIEQQIAYCDDKSKHQSDMEEILRYSNTAYGLRLAHNYIDIAPTVNDCPNCEYKKNYDYISSSSSYKELQALRQFKKDNERPQDRWGKWSVSEIQCPNCLEYFQTDCYSKEELNKCPICGAEMRKGGAE